MRKLFLSLLLISLLVPLFLARADNGMQQKDTEQAMQEIRERYDKANRDWRINILRFILDRQQQLVQQTITAMRDFTAITRSYIDLNRKGKKLAKELYYLNLENIKKLQQLEKRLKETTGGFEQFDQNSFMALYAVNTNHMETFKDFKSKYEEIMNFWRQKYENALKSRAAKEIKQVRQDMILLRAAIRAFIIFPGTSANKIPQLQTMERNLTHAIITLKTHIDEFGKEEQENANQPQ